MNARLIPFTSATQLTVFIFFPHRSRIPCHRRMLWQLVKSWLAHDESIPFSSFNILDERYLIF